MAVSVGLPLAVSNLAWSQQDEDAALDLLAREGVQGVEVAPTRLAPWDRLTDVGLRDYRAKLKAQGLTVSSLQAICYGKPEMQLLGDSFQPFIEHMKVVADAAWALGTRVWVFGAPHNRRLIGSPAKLVDRLGRLGDIIAPSIFAIEPVPPIYGGEFLTSWREVLQVVREVDHPGIKVHLDTACVAMNVDDIGEAIEQSTSDLAHFHVAQPNLGDFSDPLPDHAKAFAALHKADYRGWMSLEMRETTLEKLEQAVRFVSESVRRS